MDTYKAKYTLFKHYIYNNSIFLYHVGMPLFTGFVPISSLSMFYMCIIHFLLNSRIGSEGHIWNFWNICKNLILTSHDFGYICNFLISHSKSVALIPDIAMCKNIPNMSWLYLGRYMAIFEIISIANWFTPQYTSIIQKLA